MICKYMYNIYIYIHKHIHIFCTHKYIQTCFILIYTYCLHNKMHLLAEFSSFFEPGTSLKNFRPPLNPPVINSHGKTWEKICERLCTCIVSIYVSTCECMCTCSVSIYVSMCVLVLWKYVYVYTCGHMHMYLYIYTYIYICMRWRIPDHVGALLLNYLYAWCICYISCHITHLCMWHICHMSCMAPLCVIQMYICTFIYLCFIYMYKMEHYYRLRLNHPCVWYISYILSITPAWHLCVIYILYIIYNTCACVYVIYHMQHLCVWYVYGIYIYMHIFVCISKYT